MEPVEELVDVSVEEPVVEPVEELVVEPVEELVVESVEEFVEEPVEEPVVEPVEETVMQPVVEENTVTIIKADIENDDTPVVPVVIADEADDTEDEEEQIDSEPDEDAAEDKKVVSAADGTKVYISYDYSFRAKLMLSSEEAQSRYALISDTLAAYGLKCRESWKKERYFAKGKTYANIVFRGKTLCVYLAIAPESLEGTKYFYENVSATKKYESIPVMVRVRSARGCKYVIELIKMMFEGAGIEQKRAVIDAFNYRTATVDELIDMGFIKVIMTDADGKAVTPPEDDTMSLKLKKGMTIQKRVTVEEAAVVPDEDVAQFIETEGDDEASVGGRRKGIVNIDTISDAYSDGDVVTLQSLIAKKLLPKNTDLVKVLARGALDKAITVKAHDFSMDAAKMIIIAGGSVVKLKTKS